MMKEGRSTTLEVNKKGEKKMEWPKKEAGKPETPKAVEEKVEEVKDPEAEIPTSTPEPTPVDKNQENLEKGTAKIALRYRLEPKNDDLKNVKGIFSKGSPVLIYDRKGKWGMTKVKGEEFWVMLKFIKFDK